MDSLDYKKLYELQDQVLDVVFETENEFYLTGGTCLSRFYQEKRYSNDLDFFTNTSARYSFAVKNLKLALQKKFTIKVEVESKDFTRFKVNELLQLDFINDISVRYKDVVVSDKKYLIDNVENILSNKLTAVIGRDDPKDIFDIYLIAKFYSFSWVDMLESAHAKAGFFDDDLLVRLKSFPVELLNNINIIDRHFLDHFNEEFPNIVEEIRQKSEHIKINIEK